MAAPGRVICELFLFSTHGNRIRAALAIALQRVLRFEFTLFLRLTRSSRLAIMRGMYRYGAWMV
jgi:hypothetical protein